MTISSLVITLNGFAEEPRSGGHIRLDNTVAGLLSLGSVDYFAVSDRPKRHVDTDQIRVLEVERPPRASRCRSREIAWLPSELRGWRNAVTRQALEGWRRPSYDLVWYSRVSSYYAVEVPLPSCTIVDLDNLEDRKCWQRVGLGLTSRRLSDLRPVGGAAVDALRWRRLQRRCSARVSCVTVCSTCDAKRLGLRNVAVLENGCVVTSPGGGHSVGRSPNVLLVGDFNYEPNRDAARFALNEVMPLVRSALPDARLRLVGRGSSAFRGYAGRAVELVGEVADISMEYKEAAVVLAPVRVGSGTRLKIIEALGYGIPVVATRVAADGLAVEDGIHLLLHNGAGNLARGVVTLCEDLALREKLSSEGRARFLERYTHEHARRATAAIARSVPARRSTA